MQWQGKIDFQKPITINGKPHGVEHEDSLPAWDVSCTGRIVHDEGTDKLWLGTATAWVELTPGGVGVHNHDERYFTEVEVDSMFEGKVGIKQQVNWTNVVNRPSTMAPDVHNNNAHSEVYLTATNIDFTFLQNKSLVGSGANQVAVGNHAHTGFALDGHDHDAIDIDYNNINSGLTSVDVKNAIDEIALLNGKTVKSFLYVDKYRTDSYIETGSQSKPFKTITAATAIATNGVGIYLSEGTYSENITLQEGACLFGAGASKTYLEGTLTTTNKARVYLKGFSLYNTLTLTGRASISEVFCNAPVFINGATDPCEVEAFNFTVSDVLTIGNNVETVIFTNGGVNTDDGSTCVNASSGIIVFNMPLISLKNVVTTNPAINITGTATIHVNQGLIQTTGGNAITCTSTPTLPNFISDTQYVGAGMSFGGAPTIIEGIHCLSGPVSLSGSAVQLRSSSQISYSNTISGLLSNNVQGAIDELGAMVGVTPATTGLPVDVPDTGTMRFDSSSNTLYIFNGTAWVSTVLS